MSETVILIIAIMLSDGTTHQSQREYTGYLARTKCLWEADHLKKLWGKRDDVIHFMASCPDHFDPNGEKWIM